MKTEVVRTPVVQPVEKIILEVTPGELLTIARAVGHSSDARLRGNITEVDHGITVPTRGQLWSDGLRDVVVQAGLAR